MMPASLFVYPLSICCLTSHLRLTSPTKHPSTSGIIASAIYRECYSVRSLPAGLVTHHSLLPIMRKSFLALIGLAAGAGAAVLIYRNWRHIVRHPLKLSPATYAIGVERNIPVEVEHGL